jgi:hypothetical protein
MVPYVLNIANADDTSRFRIDMGIDGISPVLGIAAYGFTFYNIEDTLSFRERGTIPGNNACIKVGYRIDTMTRLNRGLRLGIWCP